MLRGKSADWCKVRFSNSQAVERFAELHCARCGLANSRVPNRRGKGATQMTEPTQGEKVVVSKDGPYMVSGEVPIAIQIITPNREGLPGNGRKASHLTGNPHTRFAAVVIPKANHSVMILIPISGSMAVRPRAACLTPGKRKPLKGQLWR